MQNLIYEDGSGDKVMSVIFDACRANPQRETKVTGEHVVLFCDAGSGRHIASVMDKADNLIGSALVDEHDC